MKKWYCSGCKDWKPEAEFHLAQASLTVEDRRCFACVLQDAQTEAVASKQDIDYSSDEVLERRIETHRRMRRERQQLAERLYLKFVDDVLLNQLVADRDRSLNWKEMACLAVVGADALLAALDEQQDQPQIPPYEG